jgi:alkanesulfonate monooxygenase SsuD/methylene tetrahydromethanopterin reductase-like flavin-dependent oxidoreductase (luciferase family)
MDVPRPTTAPAGRLLRLGVVLDSRNPVGRLREVARMCDRAGIGALWAEDPPAPDGGARLEAWTALALVAADARRARLGALLDPGARGPALLARMAATLAATVEGRLELTLRAAAGAEEGLGAAVEALRRELAATWVPSRLEPGRAGPVLEAVALPAERPTLGVAIPTAGAAALEWAASLPVDDVVLPTAPVAATLAAAAAARRAAAAAGRDPTQLGIAVRLPVSVGRTGAEAQARWDAEPAFAGLGRPEQAGVFGTLEECHQRVATLAHAGVTDLRCLLPNAIDIHDVIAQLTAMTIGSVDKLVPGAPRTRVPEPPPGWGGRSRFPQPSPEG